MVHPATLLDGGSAAGHHLEHLGAHRSHCNLSLRLVRSRIKNMWPWKLKSYLISFLSRRSHDLVALLANYGSILYIVAFFPVVYILNRSLRGAMLMCMSVFSLHLSSSETPYLLVMALKDQTLKLIFFSSGFMALGTVMRAIVLQSPGASMPVFTFVFPVILWCFCSILVTICNLFPFHTKT